jgi:tetratricopeptide (TPR) repeat protein
LQQSETQRALVQALPRLDSSAMMLGAVQLMHRSTRRDLERSQQLLEALVDRHKRSVAPWAWLAKWHIMQVVQGMAADPYASFQRAIDIADRALDMVPDSELALAVKGHAMCHLGKDVDGSNHLLLEATHANPNDPMAWLYRSVWSTMWGPAQESVTQAENALRLSPLDPQKYYFEMMLASCHLSTHNLVQAIQYSRSSLKKNRFHLPTLRTLVTASFEAGKTEECRSAFDVLIALQPDLTLERYLAAGGRSPLRIRGARALEAMGLRQV